MSSRSSHQAFQQTANIAEKVEDDDEEEDSIVSGDDNKQLRLVDRLADQGGNRQQQQQQQDEEEEEEEEEEDLVSDATASDDESEHDWIENFVSEKGHEFFCSVDTEFIQDDFNLTNLNTIVPHYEDALDIILSLDDADERRSPEQQDAIDSSVEVLYGVIHSRFILSVKGLQKMYDKFMNADFGRCPRLACQGQHVLPIGITDNLRTCPVNVYCPRCQEAYYTRSNRHAHIDGAYFGTTFAHMFLLHYNDLIPKKSGYRYVPKIYGFKINSESPYYTLRSEEGSGGSPSNSSQNSNNGGGGLERVKDASLSEKKANSSGAAATTITASNSKGNKLG